MDLLSHLKTLVSAPGLSGHEAPIRDLIREAWTPLTNEIGGDRLGSLWATKHGTAKAPRKKVMLSAHMDAIGLMVTRIRDGFLYVTEIGGVDPRVMPGQPVWVHGKQTLPGLVASTPPHLLTAADRETAVKLQDLIIDVGLPAEEVQRLVKIGDLVSYGQPPIELAGDLFVSKSLDNRASVAAVTTCLDLLKSRPHQWDVVAVATTQEEETLGGAMTSAFGVRPDLAIVIDVTHGSMPGLPEHKTNPVGEGLVLDWGANVHPKMFKAVRTLAEAQEIPYTVGLHNRHSGTDAYAIQVTREGIPCVLLSIPLRYMHTPVETISLKDVQRVGRLMAEYIATLNDDMLNELILD